MKIITIGNYPPRKCGIATFTENLVNSIKNAANLYGDVFDIEIIAMNNPGQEHVYPSIVSRTIVDNNIDDYIKAANYINSSNFDICLVQHEFGIFGGRSGLYLLSLLKKISIPIITTCHTVLEQPSFHEKEIMKEIGNISSKIIVMNSIAIGILNDVCNIPEEKVALIEHGVPDFSKMNRRELSKHSNFANRDILLTFGLLSKNKGIELAIKSLPKVVEQHPNILYIILGKTHPNVVKASGEKYRDNLKSIVKKLHLEDNVMFVDKFVQEKELMEYLSIADIYITPYYNKAQITSGTLSYAVAAGAAVISTPYLHAEEVLSKGRGRLFDFGDIPELSNQIIDLLDNPITTNQIKRNAFSYGQTCTWVKVGNKYLNCFSDILHYNKKQKNYSKEYFSKEVPEFSLEHFHRLNDNTSIIQHANNSIPNLDSGYCVDDTTRALIAAVMSYNHDNDKKILPYIYRYLSFLEYMQTRDGHFYNFLSYNRTKVTNDISEDALGRAIWSLGLTVRYAPNESIRQFAKDILHKSLKNSRKLNLRGFANSIIGFYHYLKYQPDNDEYINNLVLMADKINDEYNNNQTADWDWFENVLAYDNALLPLSLFLAYKITSDEKYLVTARKTTSFLDKQCFENDNLSIIGNNPWYRKGGIRSKFDQQPVDAMAMVLLYETIYKQFHESYYLDKLEKSFQWFLGRNDLCITLYDEETKGCCDGLKDDSVNTNQGAESTLAYIISWLTFEQISEIKEIKFISRKIAELV